MYIREHKGDASPFPRVVPRGCILYAFSIIPTALQLEWLVCGVKSEVVTPSWFWLC